MRLHALLVMTLVGTGMVLACSDDDSGDGSPGGAGGTGGSAGTTGMAGNAGTGGSSGSTSGAGGATTTPPVPAIPALPPGSPTVACGTQIDGVLETSDGSQTGRHARVVPVSACGMTKGFPSTGPDATGPHLFDVYRFSNPTATPTCFNFTLSYGAGGVVGDAGADAGDAGTESGLDASAGTAADAGDAGDAAAPPPGVPLKYLTAYSTFYPTDLAQAYLGDVGATLTSPQSMGITVPANGTIDVVVYAIDPAPDGVGAYTLNCSAP
jgi:hypothetical protein